MRRAIGLTRRFLAASVLVLFALIPTSASAQVQVLDPSVEFRGSEGERLVRTVNIQVDSGVEDVVFVRHDLLDGSGHALLASSISLEPAKLENPTPGVHEVVISVTAPDTAGVYEGDLTVQGGGSPSPIALMVTVDAPLAVVATPAALTLGVSESWNDIPGAGSPASGKGGHAEGVIELQHDGTTDATIQNVDVVGFRKATGETLPAETVKVVGQQDTIPAGSVVTLPVEARGANLEAGEYTGAIVIHVVGQPAALQVPVTVTVKDGLLLPACVLVFGVMASILFTYWSNQGRTYVLQNRRIMRLSKDIDSKDRLPAQIRGQGLRDLKTATGMIESGDVPEPIVKIVDRVEALLASTRDVADKLLSGSVQGLEDRVNKQSGPGKRLKQHFLESVAVIRERILEGFFDNHGVAEAQADFLSQEVDRWKEAVAKFDDLDPARKDALRGQLDEAPDLLMFESLLETPPPAGKGLAGGAPAPGNPGVSGVRRFRLTVLETAVTVITVAFVLVLGWITLYLSPETFGSDLKDYITLFLWGGATSGVLGKAINLGDLKTLVVQ